MFTKNSKDLIQTLRFDVIIKYLYAKSIKENYETDYFKEMYKEHLRIWNGFKEYNNPNKNTFEDFDNIFKKLIIDIEKFGFTHSKSQIPVYNGNHILNGSHRLAASIVHNKDVVCIDGKDKIDGMLNCSWEFFKSLGYPQEFADRTAIEYAKLKSNTFMVFLFPSAKGKYEQVYNILNSDGKVFYTKSIELNNLGSFNLIRELYLDETWGGNYNSNFSGFRYKQKLCYDDYSPTRVFLVEFENLQDSILAKNKIRNLYKIGKNSVHINDTSDETIRLAKLVFNKNSIHNLNNTKPTNYNTFNRCLDDFKITIDKLNLDIDDYCIVGSSPLSAYGIRESRDLDYLHKYPTLIKNELDLIHSHNEYGKDKYHINRDEIIYNPKNHFYHRGVKFASLNVIKKMKEKRGEPKDIVDIKLIDSINETVS